MSPPVLITGASGFVGRALVANLVAAGHAVRVATRHPTTAFPAGVDVFVSPDLERPTNWPQLLEGVEAVVHLAGVAHVGPEVAEPTYDRVNRQATAQLAIAAARTAVRRLVFLSSLRAQTGPVADHVLTEADEPRPTDAYGRSKLAAEQSIRAAGVPFTILRPGPIYGPGVKGNLERLMRLAALPLPLPFGAFENRRSLVALDDVIAAIRLALDSPATLGKTFIVADRAPLTLAQMIAALRAGLGREPLLLSVPPVWFSAALRLVRRAELWDRLGGTLVADPAQLIAAGWQPRIGTQAGLAAMAQAASPWKSGTASRSTR